MDGSGHVMANWVDIKDYAGMLQINVDYDFRLDSNGKDPDKYSATLRSYHKALWSKPLPGGEMFELDDSTPGVYLHHKSALGEFFLSSDSVIPTFAKWKRYSHIISQITEDDRNYFHHIGYTIGGMVIFPSNRVDGLPTMNGERGFNRKIVDRFDLTLECIRRHYLGDASPMSSTLSRYREFFSLFTDFRGYVEFFLLDGLVASDYSKVNFFTPFDDFGSPLPQTLEEYIAYRENTIVFITGRNQRIEELSLNG